MLIGCPKCKTRYRIDDDKIGGEGIKLRCSSCKAVFRVSRPATAPVATPAAPAVAAPAVATVVVGHESPDFCDAVKKVLASEPFRVICFNDGNEAFISLRNQKPDVALLDVALPGKYGFEICEQLKENPSTAGTKIILIASVYDSTRYKRSPESLYGADDYIEKHHIPDELATKIYRLLSSQERSDEAAGAAGADTSAQVTPQQESLQEEGTFAGIREQLKTAEETPAVPPAELSEAHVKAQRLARIIASDIALYNQGKVEEGVKTGTFYTLLAEEIAEGTTLYKRRVPDDVRSATNYLEKAFEDLLVKKRREFSV